MGKSRYEPKDALEKAGFKATNKPEKPKRTFKKRKRKLTNLEKIYPPHREQL